MRNDSDIRRDVENELRFDPDIDPADIAATVKDQVVSLTGYVRSFSQKWQAERDAKRVIGVSGIANDLEVRLPSVDQRPDPDIARDAAEVLKFQLPFWFEHVRPMVQNGWVTLEGDAEWYFQRERAETAVRHVRGVKGVSNMIAVKPSVAPTEVKSRIEEAFKRSAEVDARHINIEVDGGKITLEGKVRSWAERQEAERAAWRAPGVSNVIDRIQIGPLGV